MIIGIKSSGEIVTEPYSVGKAIEKGTTHTITTMNLIVVSFKKLVQGEIALDNIGGPITIAKQANVEAKAGVLPFFAFMAMLSVNLGILNLLPVPVLDGGHLAFFCWELVFRRPMSQKIREYAQQIGLILLLGLMILAFYNDLIGFFTNHV
jgi:regulator of sigma E protease